MNNIYNIPKSENDIIIESLGYNLLEEYIQMLSAADFTLDNFILDIATGTGRAVSVLSRMGYAIITGDYNNELRSESKKRITTKYLENINYIQLNLENIPFPNNSINNIVCLNTLHELENPEICLEEIRRIYSGKGKLLIADFNTTGFDIMDKVHLHRYGKIHTRGEINNDELCRFLKNNFSQIKEINTKLNTGFIVNGKCKREK